MSASPVTSSIANNVVLDALNGGERWSGQITFNRVETWNTAERQRFIADLPDQYVTDGTGVSDAIWNLIGQSLRMLQGYAAFSYAVTDSLDANYLVSDFRKPDNINTAGIAAQPGSVPILAFNVRNFDVYTDQQKTYIAVHELGHTLGLRHPDGLPPELNYAQYTVMSYDWFTLGDDFRGEGLPLTPMALDVSVLQASYGAPQANTGATYYYVNQSTPDVDGGDGYVSSGTAYICIWDTAGTDTLAADPVFDSLINLNAATLNTAGLSGDLADVISDVAQTSRIFAGLSQRTQLEITDPIRTAGGFFSSTLFGGARHPAGYTIAHGVTIEEGRGGRGVDLIIGNAASNVLSGDSRADELYGGAGDDWLDGGWDDDRLFGGTGQDTLVGGGGGNYLRGEEGADSLSGGELFDDMHGNMGDDTLIGGRGDDWVVGGKDQDQLFGDDGRDLVYGNLGNDTCFGGEGADVLLGGQAEDILRGGAGDDLVSGDRGADTLFGDAGADTFYSFAGAGLDRVMDFSAAEGDRVRLLAGANYMVRQDGSDVVVEMGGGDQMVLVGAGVGQLPDGWIGVA
jgi:Ca2+-binding RTX toxin-like protein